MIPQEEKILPPRLWLIVVYEAEQGDYFVFSVSYLSFVEVFSRRNKAHRVNVTAMFTSYGNR